MAVETSLDLLRYDNVGSMLRPAALKDAVERHRRGTATDADLREAQDAGIRELVAQQERRGLPLIVDGEFRRSQFQESFADVAGFDQWGARHLEVRRRRTLAEGAEDRVEAPSLRALTPATDRLRLRSSQPLEEFRFTQALTERPVKATVIGPDRIYQAFDAEASTSVYPDRQEFLDDVVVVEREIVRGLIDAGCRYVHIDAPGFTAYVDATSLAAFRARGLQPEAMLTATIAAENAVVADFPGTTFGIHICRGNEQSHWHREGAYDAIAEQLFDGLAHRRLLLEYDSERAGSFAPLRFVPDDKVVVLGLVTTKHGRVETVDEVLARVDAASAYVPVERLAISPQCGFASSMEGNHLTEDEQWRKLEVVLRAGEAIWDRSGSA